ncbi:MAG: hypothetical protein EBT79_13415 [Actinobacteria bacterium]|nr:hypothetical protein [Actinomycetota bacterium]
MSGNIDKKSSRKAHTDENLMEAEDAALKVARAVATALKGKVGAPRSSTDFGYIGVKVGVFSPELPSSASSEGAEITVDLTASLDGSNAYFAFHYYLAPRKLNGVTKEMDELIQRASDSIEGAVSEGLRAVPKLAALLAPVRARETVRQDAGAVLKNVTSEMKAWLQKALVQSGVVGPVRVWGHPYGGVGTFVTDEGAPYAAENIVIEGLIGEDEGRDLQRSREVLANTRKVLTKALSQFSSANGVVAKLSAKPAYWSAYKYNTTVIISFKGFPVESMRLAGERPSRRS